MTPSEKAKKIFNRFYFIKIDISRITAKKLSLICVAEIIEACEYNSVESYNTDWWNKVKEEIENL